MTAPRIRVAGDSAIVVELGDGIDAAVNARAVAMAARLRAEAPDGVRDVIATFRSVAVFFDPRRVELETLKARLLRLPAGPPAAAERPAIDVPVEYGGDAGPDLEAVAAGAGLSAAEVVARHAAREYRVFMVGFLPGFAYLGPVDASIAAPRLGSPRVRVPPGSVGIAGQQTGIYPQASPGGWRIIGRTTTRPFDAHRVPPALLAPGDRVRFVPVPPGTLGSFDAAWPATPTEAAPESVPGTVHGARAVSVVRPGLMTTVQDDGRWGWQHEGVPVSGAMDRVSMRDANRAVGNAFMAAALEVTLGGVEVRLEHAGALAVSGADLSATLDGRALPLSTRVEHAAGSVVRFDARRRGTRAYLAFDGGLDVTPCLGSRATDLTSGLGGVAGRRLRAGDRVPVAVPSPASRPAEPIALRPLPAGGARVRVLPGPHGEWFPPAALDLLCRTRYEVSPDSNRMGYRLRGAEPLPREAREMVSDATCPGGLQVPPSGQPILLTADRQVTGGYPIIATVITADLPVVGQLAPGDWIEFDTCTRADALAALAREESSAGGRG
ncbi:MAG TPA: 5-oxoprolinase subunit PxpB [Vicinamibacterales bacterium]|nr:5-oxoprolinase subunit PxpB [Vicinamibacterales bacterium]